MSEPTKNKLVQEGGFTLIELLVVIVLIGIISAISAPRMSTYMANADYRADIRLLLSAFKTARMEAVKRNQFCTITFSTDAAGQDVYTVYVDNDEDLIFDAPADPFNVQPGEDEPLINGSFKNAVITGNNMNTNADGDPSNTFNSKGMPLNDTGGFGGATIQLLGPSTTRKVVLSSVGRLRVH